MICFHHNDADGRCAAAIVMEAMHDLSQSGEQRYVEVDYVSVKKDALPATIMPDETVYVVDFHFSPEVMELMSNITPYIHVFDHHKSAKEAIAKYPKEVKCHCDPENKFAGCELVWNYFYPSIEMPTAVKLIADRDKWAWKFGEMTANFNEGLKLYSHQPDNLIWSELLNNNRAFIDKIIQKGAICLRYRDKLCEMFRDEWSFEAELMGYKCYVMNLMLHDVGSEMFADKINEYDICVGIVFSNGFWKLSLRSNGKVDVSEIAKKLGGGGHAQAAGAENLRELPFLYLS